MPNLITREQLDADAQRLAPLNMADIEQRARQVVDQARAEAKRILAEAVSRAREVERVAQARGHRDGYQAGLDEGRQAGRDEALQAETHRLQDATSTVRDALLEMLGEIEAHRHEVLADAKEGLLRLSVAMAQRICRAHVARADGQHLRALADEVIETVGRNGRIVLRVNPDDAAVVEQFLSDLHAPLGDDATVTLQADASISRGGCRAEHVSGCVDATLETQMARIVAELFGDGAGQALNASDAPGDADSVAAPPNTEQPNS